MFRMEYRSENAVNANKGLRVREERLEWKHCTVVPGENRAREESECGGDQVVIVCGRRPTTRNRRYFRSSFYLSYKYVGGV